MVKILLILTFVLPWLALIWADKNTIKRYAPVVVFTGLIMTIIFEIAYTYNWWTIHEYFTTWGYITDTSFAYGLFMIGTFWIFYFTYRYFWLYVLVNAIFDLFMGFVGMTLLDMLSVATMHTITKWQYSIVMFCISFVIYGYQRWQETIVRKE